MDYFESVSDREWRLNRVTTSFVIIIYHGRSFARVFQPDDLHNGDVGLTNTIIKHRHTATSCTHQPSLRKAIFFTKQFRRHDRKYGLVTSSRTLTARIVRPMIDGVVVRSGTPRAGLVVGRRGGGGAVGGGAH